MGLLGVLAFACYYLARTRLVLPRNISPGGESWSITRCPFLLGVAPWRCGRLALSLSLSIRGGQTAAPPGEIRHALATEELVMTGVIGVVNCTDYFPIQVEVNCSPVDLRLGLTQVLTIMGEGGGGYP